MNYFLKKRLIAVILVNNNFVVQTKKFKITNPVGDAFSAIDFFNSWTVDEIILLDITRKKTDSKNFYKLVDEVSQRCFVPMAVGGGIKDYNMAKELFNLGADKVVINTEALINSSIITKLMKNFGSQSCLISIDVRNNNFMRSGYEVVINNGNQPTNIDLISWLQKLNELQPGEIMINHLDHDGNKQGYDIQLLKITKRNTHLPVIAMGGVGEWSHFEDALNFAEVDAVAAGNIFHYSEQSTKKAKDYLIDKRFNFRQVEFVSLNKVRKRKSSVHY